ncbi:hypothetical protein ACMC56_08805 [Campylobacterota bacterium DY0563]
MKIIKYILHVILMLIIFPIFWFIYGIYAYIRIVFTYDNLNIYFDKYIEVFDFSSFEDKKDK